MKRENTNKIRFVLEEILPPIIRDSLIFKFIVKQLYRKDKTHEKLKSNILKISKSEYKNYYKNLPEIHQNSDNIKPVSIIDVGCGNGFLLKTIREKYKDIALTGTEIIFSKKLKKNLKKNKIKLLEKRIEDIYKIRNKYDTVVCSHVLEHVLDINLAYLNLKKICKKRLIIIVPRERAYEHTFNGHLHFFPYKWSFINTIRPKNNFVIKDLKRDLIFIEDLKN